MGQGSFLRLGLSQNFFQDLEAKRSGTGASTTDYCPSGPQGLVGVRGGGLSSYSRQQKSNWLNRSIQFRKGTQTWNANHTEMHSDNKMRKRGSGGGWRWAGVRVGEEEEGAGQVDRRGE